MARPCVRLDRHRSKLLSRRWLGTWEAGLTFTNYVLRRRLDGLTGLPSDPILSAGPFLRVPGALSSGGLTPGGVAGPGGGEAGGAGDAGLFDWTSEPPDPVVPAIKSPSSRAWRV